MHIQFVIAIIMEFPCDRPRVGVKLFHLSNCYEPVRNKKIMDDNDGITESICCINGFGLFSILIF